MFVCEWVYFCEVSEGEEGEEGRKTERDGRGRERVRKTRSTKASGCERHGDTWRERGGGKGCVNEYGHSD